ncbi:MAG: helix-turn-helix transcriptional regulator [Lachnospiraceae bacterium]|nr:helix-turn-helix transcriptional regulator [Lachnospiraceae bacterium]
MGQEMQYSIRELRARKKETQEQTAAAIGVSTQTYCAWEKDISKVAVSKVMALANHFGVKLSQIFLG